jgi:hypothetical protein
LPCNIFGVTTFTFHLKILFKKTSQQRAGYHLVSEKKFKPAVIGPRLEPTLLVSFFTPFRLAYQPKVLLSQNKSTLLSQNKSAPATSQTNMLFLAGLLC